MDLVFKAKSRSMVNSTMYYSIIHDPSETVSRTMNNSIFFISILHDDATKFWLTLAIDADSNFYGNTPYNKVLQNRKKTVNACFPERLPNTRKYSFEIELSSIFSSAFAFISLVLEFSFSLVLLATIFFSSFFLKQTYECTRKKSTRISHRNR